MQACAGYVRRSALDQTRSSMETKVLEEFGPFDYKWPSGTVERLHRVWDYLVFTCGERYKVRHGLGRREAYGRDRVRGITWLGETMIQGVEADDYTASRALISVIRGRDRREPRTLEEVPQEYAGMQIVYYRDEIDAPYSHKTFALKIGEDDLESWAVAATIRREISKWWDTA